MWQVNHGKGLIGSNELEIIEIVEIVDAPATASRGAGRRED